MGRKAKLALVAVAAFIARARMSPERAQDVLGDMPLWQYRLLHPAAKLSAEDVTAVCALSPRGP